MSTEPVTKEQLQEVAKKAVEKTYQELCSQHPESFYYIALLTTGEASPPVFAAWSREALADEIRKSSYNDPERYLKWSLVESPYYGYGEKNFEELTRLFYARPSIGTSMTREQRRQECNFRLSALESALCDLDQSGIFGSGDERKKLVVNVEVLPPDSTNTERVKRLNPPDALQQWLSEYDNS